MYATTKKIFDIFLSLMLIIVLSPILIIIIVVLYLFNKRDVFFLQKRVGYKEKVFSIIKFATMLKNSENLPGGRITLRNDPRVTKIGRILRITKLNELPQLFNVFMGEMSFVGPRPLTPRGFKLYSSGAQKYIYQSLPGITGIASIVFRDEEKMVSDSNMIPEDFYKTVIFPSKELLEKWYNQYKSINVDFKILLLTVIKLILPASRFEYLLFKNLPKINLINQENIDEHL